jgi:hypothetical protein
MRAIQAQSRRRLTDSSVSRRPLHRRADARRIENRKRSSWSSPGEANTAPAPLIEFSGAAHEGSAANSMPWTDMTAGRRDRTDFFAAMRIHSLGRVPCEVTFLREASFAGSIFVGMPLRVAEREAIRGGRRAMPKASRRSRATFWYAGRFHRQQCQSRQAR